MPSLLTESTDYDSRAATNWGAAFIRINMDVLYPPENKPSLFSIRPRIYAPYSGWLCFPSLSAYIMCLAIVQSLLFQIAALLHTQVCAYTIDSLNFHAFAEISVETADQETATLQITALLSISRRNFYMKGVDSGIARILVRGCWTTCANFKPCPLNNR